MDGVFPLQHTKLQIGIKMNKDLVEEREKKVTKMVFLMVFAFIGAWSGYAFLCILRLFGVHSSDIAFGLVMFAAKSGGWLNTLVFIFMNTQVSNFVQGQDYVLVLVCSTCHMKGDILGRSW